MPSSAWNKLVTYPPLPPHLLPAPPRAGFLRGRVLRGLRADLSSCTLPRGACVGSAPIRMPNPRFWCCPPMSWKASISSSTHPSFHSSVRPPGSPNNRRVPMCRALLWSGCPCGGEGDRPAYRENRGGQHFLPGGGGQRAACRTGSRKVLSDF